MYTAHAHICEDYQPATTKKKKNIYKNNRKLNAYITF